jgi:hypothetical protein
MLVLRGKANKISPVAADASLSPRRLRSKQSVRHEWRMEIA